MKGGGNRKDKMEKKEIEDEAKNALKI